MHNYDSLKEEYAKKIAQTIDQPILVFDYFELGEMLCSLVCIIVFQLVIGSWILMLLSLITTLGVMPIIRRSHPKGIFFHWPYRHLQMNLPGIINPKGNRNFSD